jgi:hypothetical protein
VPTAVHPLLANADVAFSNPPSLAVIKETCPQTLPPKTNKKATIPALRRINFFNKFSDWFDAVNTLNLTFDEIFTRDKKEYKDFIPNEVKKG